MVAYGVFDHPGHGVAAQSLKQAGRFSRGAAALLLTTVLAAGAAMLLSEPAHAQSRERLVRLDANRKVAVVNATLGKSETIRLNTSFVDIVVGDPDIADAMPLTDQSLYILGKKAGTTNVSIYDANKKLIGIIEVEVGYNAPRLAAEVGQRLPNSKVRVSSVNGQLMLSGEASDGVAMDKAVTMAKQFSPNVINNMSVKRSQQVMLEVRFVEASRNAGRELGVRWDIAAKNFTSTSGVTGLLSNNTPFGSILGTILSNGVQADALIQGLEEKGLARRLAEPNLVAMSGEKASFLAGGEFPFPTQGQNNVVTIEFKKFGVGLNFTPTVLANGVINLKIEPEVSQLDNTNVIRAGGVTVPALVVRRASTTVELRDGQSFAVAGLLQSVSSNTVQQLPWLGEIPILGALFRSSAFERNETDLAIIVTPRIVKPAKPGERLRTPLDTTAPANDIDFFLTGKSEVSPAEVAGRPGAVRQAASGHILDLNMGGSHAAQ
jgi:pilus assembly protein CpaC